MADVKAVLPVIDGVERITAPWDNIFCTSGSVLDAEKEALMLDAPLRPAFDSVSKCIL
jgi:hypothetical protein